MACGQGRALSLLFALDCSALASLRVYKQPNAGVHLDEFIYIYRYLAYMAVSMSTSVFLSLYVSDFVCIGHIGTGSDVGIT